MRPETPTTAASAKAADTSYFAFVRKPGSKIGACVLTYMRRTKISIRRSTAQHAAYVDALRELGVEVHFLPDAPTLPDGVFVEDMAVVGHCSALIASPVLESRRGEVETVQEALRPHRVIARVNGNGTLDGGDVLRIGRTFHVGLSQRTNQCGFEQVESWAETWGFRAQAVTFQGCLHLKTGCTFIAPDIVVLNPRWVNPAQFKGMRIVTVAENEPFAANTLTIGQTTLVSAAFPETRRKLEAVGLKTRAVEIPELHKAEAGLTCLSIVLTRPAAKQIAPITRLS